MGAVCEKCGCLPGEEAKHEAYADSAEIDEDRLDRAVMYAVLSSQVYRIPRGAAIFWKAQDVADYDEDLFRKDLMESIGFTLCYRSPVVEQPNPNPIAKTCNGLEIAEYMDANDRPFVDAEYESDHNFVAPSWMICKGPSLDEDVENVNVENPTHLYVVIRGTANGFDVLRDIQFEAVDFESFSFKCHGGVLRAAKKIFNELLPYIECERRMFGKKNDIKLHFTGHSLGGGVAQVLCAMFAAKQLEGIKPVSVHTFGSPLVFILEKYEGIEDFPLFKDAHVHHYVNNKDGVPRILGSRSLYKFSLRLADALGLPLFKKKMRDEYAKFRAVGSVHYIKHLIEEFEDKDSDGIPDAGSCDVKTVEQHEQSTILDFTEENFSKKALVDHSAVGYLKYIMSKLEEDGYGDYKFEKVKGNYYTIAQQYEPHKKQLYDAMHPGSPLVKGDTSRYIDKSGKPRLFVRTIFLDLYERYKHPKSDMVDHIGLQALFYHISGFPTLPAKTGDTSNPGFYEVYFDPENDLYELKEFEGEHHISKLGWSQFLKRLTSVPEKLSAMLQHGRGSSREDVISKYGEQPERWPLKDGIDPPPRLQSIFEEVKKKFGGLTRAGKRREKSVEGVNGEISTHKREYRENKDEHRVRFDHRVSLAEYEEEEDGKEIQQSELEISEIELEGMLTTIEVPSSNEDLKPQTLDEHYFNSEYEHIISNPLYERKRTYKSIEDEEAPE